MYPRYYKHSSRLECQVKKQVLVSLSQQLKVDTTPTSPLLLKYACVGILGTRSSVKKCLQQEKKGKAGRKCMCDCP